MSNVSPTIVAASLDDEKLKASIEKMVQNLNDGLEKMKKNTDSAVEYMQKSLQKLGNVKVDSGGAADGGASKRAKANNEETASIEKSTSAVEKKTATLDQQAQAMQSAAAAGKKYSDEIIRQANAIREMKEWQEKGYAMVGERVYYDPERSSLSAKKKLSLEEQILNTQKEQEVETIRQAAAERQEVVEKAAAEQEARRQLAVETQITQEQTRRSQSKNFTSYDSLRDSIAHVLGLQQSQVKLADAETASYNNLDKTLKQLNQTYNRLTNAERNSEQGKALVASIHEVERAMQKIRSQAARPISLNSIIGINGKGGLSEKTLDDIAYKLRQLQSYKMGLDLNSSKATSEIRQIDNEINRLKKDMDKYMSTGREVNSMNNALGRSFNYMKNRLAFYFTVGASTAFVKNLIEIRAQYEMNERALGILINSAEKGSQIFQELSQMALVSPYTLIELSSAAKQLTAYDIAAKDVVDTTRRLADMASAVGVPMERLTYALGQIKAYGYLNSRDARMFANAGIPLVRELSKYYTELEGKMVSVGDVYDRMKKKAIDFNDVMSVVTKMTDEGGKFFDFQAKMADTLKVRLANLTLAWNNMLNEIGKSEQGVLTSGIGLLKELFLRWKDINRAIENLIIVFGFLKAAQLAYYGVVLGTNKAIAIETVLGTKLSNILRTLGATMNTVLTSGATWWGLLAVSIGAAVVEIARGNEAMKEFNKTLRENANNTYGDLEKFTSQYTELRNSLYKTIKDSEGKSTIVPQDINADDAKKAWEAVKEQIELSSHVSDEYISRLLSINNISERLRQSFAVIDNIKSVSAAIKELGDNSIKLERDWSAWWNLWLLPDGTIGNLQDVHMWLGKIEERYGSIERAKKAASGEEKAPLGIDKRFQEDAESFLRHYEKELERFKKDIESTKESVLNFISMKGWSGDVNKINEVFSQITDNLIQQNQLDPEKAFTLQLEMEEARSAAAKQAQAARIKDLAAAYRQERDEELKEEISREYSKEVQIYNNWEQFNGRQRVEWNRFTKYLKEQHLSEMTAMFRGMNAKQIESLNFQEGKYADWVKRMVTDYAKSHKMSYDDAFNYLKSWVTRANQWSIFIPLTISTEDNKTVEKSLEEADAAADKAYKTIQRLDKEIARLKKKGAKEVDENNVTASEDDKRLTQALKEKAAAQKDYDKAVAEGGESKKENSAASKAQATAEKEVTEAFKNELSVLKEMQSAYDKLRKAGVDNTTAIDLASSGYEQTLKRVNATLAKYGISKFNASDFLGKDVNAVLRKLEQQRADALASGKLKSSELKELDVEISKLNVDAKTYNMDKITKGLNSELDKLKDEYELALDLDANPELGDVFADMMGLDKEQLAELPRDFEGVMNKLQGIIDEKLGKGVFNLSENLNKSSFENWLSSQGTDLDNERAKILNSYVDYANKVRQDETKKQIDEWNKLLEKYSEYEYKRKQIMDTASRERETAIKKGASQEIIDAINNRENEELAKLDFEEFQKSSDWIVATGDLANLSKAAIGGLIDELEKYKRSAKNLNPKQIKQLNSALSKLYKEQRKNSPFKAISNMLQQAKENAEQYTDEIDEIQKKINDLYAKQDQSNMSETGSEIDKLIKKYKELKKKQEDAGKVDATQWVSSINETVNAVGAAVGVFDDLAKAIGGVKTSDIDRVFDTLEKGGQGAAIGAQISGGSGYGAIIGAVAGLASGIISNWSDVWSGNADITKWIEISTRAIKRLEQSYNNLQYQIEKTAGTAEFSLRKVAIANKELQLAELERQLQLEKSRKAKNRDEDKISDLESQINDLKIEIKKASDDIINDLLGISSVGDAAENMMDAFIEALRSGEDAMAGFNESIDEMIANMLKKLLVTKFIMPRLEKIWEDIQSDIDERTKEKAAELAQIDDDFNSVLSGGDVIRMGTSREGGSVFNNEDVKKYAEKWYDAYKEATGIDEAKIVEQTGKFDEQFLEWVYEEWLKRQAERKKQLEYEMSTAMNEDDIKKYAEKLRNLSPEMQASMEYVDSLIKELGLTKDDAKQLSALQQGISGITETTAGALEAYMNGVSQQVYLHSDLLVEIRDAVVGLSMDVQIGAMSQILLQLRSSYEVQMSIQSLLSGWNNPAGNAIRVEMI